LTIRLLADARGNFRKKFVDRLVEIADGTVDLRLHFGDRDSDFEAAALHRLDTRTARRGHLIDATCFAGANLDLLASARFREILERGVDQMQRMAQPYRYSAHNVQNLHDYIDYLHILSDAYAQLIEQEGITHAIFYTMPHLAYDTILLETAQAMGVRTIVLSQTLFPGRFFSTERVQDFGYVPFGELQAPPYEIEKGSTPDFFYMDTKWQREGQTGKLTGKAVWQFIRYAFRKEPSLVLRPRSTLAILRRMAAIYGRLPDWRDPFANFFHTNELAYFEHLAEYERQEVDLYQPFIYFPLQNQPEMSTSTLGGDYRDQLRAVEALSRHLPQGWRILIKENPRQGAYARGPMFWHRLNRIPNVQFVPSATSTHSLSDHAQFVAAITSNAGWEAIRKGKPALVFGNPWYKSLPGVTRFSEGVNFTALAASTFDHAELEAKTGELFARSHEGVIEKVYSEIAGKRSEEENLTEVANTSLRLLSGEQQVTFPIP
jgi:hypothetical protein